MNKKYTIVGLLVFFLWIPFSFAQEVSLKNAKKLFKDNKFQESAKIFLQLANEREDSEAFYLRYEFLVRSSSHKEEFLLRPEQKFDPITKKASESIYLASLYLLLFQLFEKSSNIELYCYFYS